MIKGSGCYLRGKSTSPTKAMNDREHNEMSTLEEIWVSKRLYVGTPVLGNPRENLWDFNEILCVRRWHSLPIVGDAYSRLLR